MKLTLLFLSLLLCACTSPGASSLTDRSPSASSELGFLPDRAEKGTLFRYYQAKAESKWRNNWTANFDLTGVSWNDPRCATLIAPRYVVMAAHFIRPSNVPVMFHDRNGKPYERYITAVRPLKIGDVAVARLNLPLPPEIKFYAFASLNDATMGRPVIVSDQTNTLSIHRIAAITSGVISLNFAPDLSPLYRRNLIAGDSGHPSFLVKYKTLTLLETHTTGGPGAGPFYGDPGIQNAIRTAMLEMGN